MSLPFTFYDKVFSTNKDLVAHVRRHAINQDDDDDDNDKVNDVTLLLQTVNVAFVFNFLTHFAWSKIYCVSVRVSLFII